MNKRTSLGPLSPVPQKPRKKRTRKRSVKVADCSTTNALSSLSALETRLNRMRIAEVNSTQGPFCESVADPAEAVRGATLTQPQPPSQPKKPSRPAGAPTRPHFVKPLVACKHLAPIVPTPPTVSKGTGAATAGNALRPLPPSRPVTANASTTRRPRPGILKKRRRTRSATTRASGGSGFVPQGMIVSLPPLQPVLPTHDLLSDAYVPGFDDGSTEASASFVDTDSYVDTPMASDDDMEGWPSFTDEATPLDSTATSGFGTSVATSSSRPSISTTSANNAFVHDMLVSLDDSLEEAGFRDALHAAAAAEVAAQQQQHPSSSGLSRSMVPTPLNDSPTLFNGGFSLPWEGDERMGSPSDNFVDGLPSLSSPRDLSDALFSVDPEGGFTFDFNLSSK